MRLQIETRSLPTELSPEDLAEESKKLATAVEEVKGQKEHIAEKVGLWKETKKALEGKLAYLEDEMNALAAIVDTGIADREVECSWLYALKQGYGFLVRDDTGKLVHHRRLGDQERQTELLEVLREPTDEQLAAWIAELGLVVDPQGALPLAAPEEEEEPVAYYRAFILPGADGLPGRVIARFSEADHRPSSLTGVHAHDSAEGTGLPESGDRSSLSYEEDPDTLRTYRQALEDLLETKKTEALKSRGVDDPAAPTPIGREKRK